jgi:hypothetical protein
MPLKSKIMIDWTSFSNPEINLNSCFISPIIGSGGWKNPSTRRR